MRLFPSLLALLPTLTLGACKADVTGQPDRPAIRMCKQVVKARCVGPLAYYRADETFYVHYETPRVPPRGEKIWVQWMGVALTDFPPALWVMNEGQVARGDGGRVVIWGQLAPTKGALHPTGKMRAEIYIGGDLEKKTDEFVGGTLVAKRRFSIGPARR